MLLSGTWKIGVALGVLFASLAGTSASLGAQSRPEWAYPDDTRTGIPSVDAAIVAVLAQDATSLRSQFRFVPRECTEPGIGEIRCPEGQPVGTVVEVFAVAD